MTRGQGDTKRLTQVAARNFPATAEQAALGSHCLRAVSLRVPRTVPGSDSEGSEGTVRQDTPRLRHSTARRRRARGPTAGSHHGGGH